MTDGIIFAPSFAMKKYTLKLFSALFFLALSLVWIQCSLLSSSSFEALPALNRKLDSFSPEKIDIYWIQEGEVSSAVERFNLTEEDFSQNSIKINSVDLPSSETEDSSYKGLDAQELSLILSSSDISEEIGKKLTGALRAQINIQEDRLRLSLNLDESIAELEEISNYEIKLYIIKTEKN